jgi:hypothetical protein
VSLNEAEYKEFSRACQCEKHTLPALLRHQDFICCVPFVRKERDALCNLIEIRSL